MENKPTPAETRFKDLSGHIAVNFRDHMDLGKLLAKEASFNPQRFEVIALRVYLENELQLTVYAIDKERQKTWDHADKLPVHKFKIAANLGELMPLIHDLNFTLSTGAYDLDMMEVINK